MQAKRCICVLPEVQLLWSQLLCLCAGTPASSEELLRLPCDVLIPASISGIITAENAPELQCKARPATRAPRPSRTCQARPGDRTLPTLR